MYHYFLFSEYLLNYCKIKIETVLNKITYNINKQNIMARNTTPKKILNNTSQRLEHNKNIPDFYLFMHVMYYICTSKKIYDNYLIIKFKKRL